MGLDDPHTMALFEDMRLKRRAWTRTIEKAKTSHSRQFLDEAGEGKLCSNVHETPGLLGVVYPPSKSGIER
jgi:hypothetical protein